MWAWLDPGVIAVIGAGSLLGGVTRLNLAVTVIVVKIRYCLSFCKYLNTGTPNNALKFFLSLS